VYNGRVVAQKYLLNTAGSNYTITCQNIRCSKELQHFATKPKTLISNVTKFATTTTTTTTTTKVIFVQHWIFKHLSL
jgi:hypothetical protein